MTTTELAKQYFALQAQSEAQSAALKEINSKWTECERELLEAMAEEGVNSVAIDGMGRFSMVTKNFLSVNAANKPGFYEYLQSSGNGALLKLDVNPKTLTAFLKEHLEELITERKNNGMDPIDARKDALEFLNKKGASYFSDRSISLRRGE